ncbi:cyclase [Abditibacterium utsteinense]|uniref:Imidazole glycerol phosphate synthase subunit HisF n=1 Tax=Abditibacterium utsteinense TaxID=1960156 RepID=A0A2S8SUD9_9BACT|nr:imidazole glycerol phosphate synthase subunit HisF [Abditibacterium utsteinense]PQV64410.1 cyclase [Abditibacterium utsteinense]
MPAKRIIPALDINAGRVVKCVQFENMRDAGDPIERAAFYDQEGADELVFLDITASHEKRDIISELAAKVCEEAFIPFTVGGGLKTTDEMAQILAAGADKIFINTSAFTTPNLIREGAERFGVQCMVVAIDAKQRGENDWQVFLHGGRTPTGKNVVEWAKEAEKLGAGEILLTSMDGDGTQSGYDLKLTRAVAEAVSIPVIASGGAGNIDHIYDALTIGKAEAALVASIVHYGTYKIRDIKTELRNRGVEVRI